MGRAQIASRLVGFQKIREIFRSKTVKGFIRDEADFKGDALLDWEPVEFVTKGRNVIGAFDGRVDETDERVLNELKAMKGGLGKIEEKGIAIV